MEDPTKMDDFGVPLFYRKPPYLYHYPIIIIPVKRLNHNHLEIEFTFLHHWGVAKKNNSQFLI